MRDRPTASLDVVGVALFAGAGIWMWLASAGSSGSPAPGIALLAACGLALLAPRNIGSPARLLVPAAVLVAAVILAARSRTGVLSTAPLSGPLEYINADGALYVQVAIAGLMLVCCPRPWLLRIIGGVVALVCATLPFIIHALAAAWLVVVLPAIALLSVAVAGTMGARVAVLLCASLFVASLAGTIWVGGTYSPSPQPSALQRAALEIFDRDRLVFWHEAFDIMRRNPGTGVGPARYQVVSPVARSSRDDRWAHHEFLQQGAEGGIAGLVFLASIFLWGFARLSIVGTPDAITALSAAALAALGIHACVDYVMHFPAIPIVTAALVATGMTGWVRDPLPEAR